MLRRIPSTPLVCLVIFLSTIFLNASWAAAPDESLDILLKPNQGVSAPVTAAHKAKTRAGFRAAAPAAVVLYPPLPPLGITKVKPQGICGPVGPGFSGCILPMPMPGQWEMGVQMIFGRTRGIVAWPRYTPYLAWGSENSVNLNDDLGLPAHAVVPEFTARYQFRPNWSFRYTVIGFQFNGGNGTFQGGSNGFGVTYFGNIPLTWGLQVSSQWQHTWQTLELVYDALKTCNSVLSISGGWLHTDDRITANCVQCGYYTGIFSKGGDSGYVAMQLQQCVRTAQNGGSFSLDNKVGAIFGDDAYGWDIQLGGRYSIPLNCGRSGYAKGGYRFVDYKKNQQDFILTNAIEGGFVEFGFIF